MPDDQSTVEYRDVPGFRCGPMFELWPHQRRAVDEVLAAIAGGAKRIILSSPTGGGKSLAVATLIQRLTAQEKRCQLYANRKMLVEQIEKSLIAYGVDFGIRAAGYEFQPYYPVQLSSVQTEHARVVKTKEQRWPLFDADVVFIDEGHLANNDQYQQLVAMYLERGAVVVYVTATPLNMTGLADILIVAGTNSELRECGSLVPALVYGAPEPDFKRFKIGVGQELTEPQVLKLFNIKKIYGHIVEWYDRVNPERKPTILFAPGVEESRWLAEHLSEAGITAAHIDADDIYVDGKFHKSSPSMRQEILDRSRAGTLKVLTNRFILRTGIDAPWFEHMILATTLGDILAFLQTVGRGLRTSPGKKLLTIQDHGGNYWRWGSPNADRQWELDWTSRMVQGEREDRLREKLDREPCRCPKCGLILAGRKCPCGYAVDEFRKMRPIVQSDGTVVEHVGDIFVQKIRRFIPDCVKKWNNCYFRAAATKWTIDGREVSGIKLCKAANEATGGDLKAPFGVFEAAKILRDLKHEIVQTGKGMTFAQAEGMYFHEFGVWPPRNLGLMPSSSYDWFRRVPDVHRDRLNTAQKQES